MSLSEAKSKSRCSKCQQVGHWHRDPECPLNKPGANQASKPKEIHLVESEEAIFCGLLDRADETDPEVTNESPAISLSGHFGLAETVQDSVNTDHGYGQSNFEAAYKGCRADGCVDSVGIGGSGRLDVAVGGMNMKFIGLLIKSATTRGTLTFQRTNCVPRLIQVAKGWLSAWIPSRR